VIPVLFQNPSQVILENVERAGEYVERAFGIGRIVPIAGQPFNQPALASNNAPPVDDMAKSISILLCSIGGSANAKGGLSGCAQAARGASQAAPQARRITINIAGSCSNFLAAFSIASRSSAASISPSLMDFGKAG
jgi:hypothetical protein